MNIAGIAPSSGIHAVSGASSGAPPQQKMSNLFDSIDTSGSGSITQAQFDQAFQTKNPPAVFQKQGADAIFASLDPAGTGSVSKQDFVSTMSGLMASLRAGSPTQS
jgi:Ca2+-binding EF-hand superfamily protein